MAVKQYKPTSNGRRLHSVTDYSVLSKNAKTPKYLIISKSKTAGRNFSGKITVRHRGGGFKKLVRVIDYSRADKMDIPAKVLSVEYAPGRSSFLSLVSYRDGEKRYIIAPHGIKVGQTVIAGLKAEPQIGNRMQLKNVPTGTFVHDIEMAPGKKGTIARSAGAYAILQTVEDNYALLKMPSGEIRKVPENSMATIGQVSNTDWMNVRIGKAGRKRMMGWRPTVRGKAMNPVDHPHGGGEGHNPIGMKYPKTPWGKHALGVRTRDKKKPTGKLIVKRRK
ncbi:50S ribosomal protein L2 [Patescibacteria group bacterium]|nr:50S ribosomal protein L2 [Patescibacteria group bacterium]